MKLEEKQISGAALTLIMALLFSVTLIKTPRITAANRQDGTGSLSSAPEAGGKASGDAMNGQRKRKEETEDTGKRPAWVTSYSKLNVRRFPDREAEILGYFVCRQEVTAEGGKENGFYHVSGIDSYTGGMVSGYCSGEYLTFDAPGDPQVRLDVPAYYQADPRWASVKIGSTKKTMEAIGCTTACMAMAKTYLTKSEVLPDAMEELLWYNENGDMAWPVTYARISDETCYLEVVFRQLHKDVPVLIGAERKNGSPHWVLITGYKGDALQLKPEDFLINDPLTEDRTNLQQFLDEYPRFDKIAYYSG